MENPWDKFFDLGQNPTCYIPEGKWIRVYCSGTGNVEVWAEYSHKIKYTILCD